MLFAGSREEGDADTGAEDGESCDDEHRADTAVEDEETHDGQKVVGFLVGWWAERSSEKSRQEKLADTMRNKNTKNTFWWAESG